MIRQLLVPAIAFAAAAASLPAQDIALPFHQGQWGTNIGFSSGFTALGVLRFRNPTHAWILDASGSLSHSSFNATSSGQPPQSGGNSQQTLNMRLGTRAFHEMGEHVDRQFTVGVTGNYQHEHASNAFKQWRLGAGVFADVGAEWLVTSHLGLGASWGGTFTYNWSRDTSNQPSDSRSSSIAFSFGNAVLRGAFYF